MGLINHIKYCTTRSHHLVCGHKIFTHRIQGCGRNCLNPNGPRSHYHHHCLDCSDNYGACLFLSEINRNDAIRATLSKFGKMAYSEQVEANMQHREAAMKFKVPAWIWEKFVREKREVFQNWLASWLQGKVMHDTESMKQIFGNDVDPESQKLRTELEIQQVALENYLELSRLVAIDVPEDLFADKKFEITMEILRQSTMVQILQLGASNTRAARVNEQYVRMYGHSVNGMSLGQVVNLGSALRAMFNDLSHKRRPHSAESSPTLSCSIYLTEEEEKGAHSGKGSIMEPLKICSTVSSSTVSSSESPFTCNSFDSCSTPVDEEQRMFLEARNEHARQETLERIYALVGKPAPSDKATRTIQVPPTSKSVP